MPRGKTNQHADILEYALSHLEKERDTIQERIDHIRRQLGSRSTVATQTSSAKAAAPEAAARKKRKPLSEAARKRIAAAQKRRWADHRKKQKAAE